MSQPPAKRRSGQASGPATGLLRSQSKAEIPAPQVEFVPGTLMHDKRSDRIGVVMELLLGSVFLRPVHGGQEWQASPEDLERVDRAAELSARVAEVNRCSRERL